MSEPSERRRSVVPTVGFLSCRKGFLAAVSGNGGRCDRKMEDRKMKDRKMKDRKMKDKDLRSSAFHFPVPYFPVECACHSCRVNLPSVSFVIFGPQLAVPW